MSLPGAEQVLAEPGAAADHLPELDVGVDRLGEDQVHDSGTSMPVSSMSTEMAMVRSGSSFALEVVDQFLGPRVVVVDDPAEVAAVLRVHLVEEVLEQDGVVVVCGRR